MRWRTHEALFDETRAYEFVEEQVWPHGPVCPRCNRNDRIGKLRGGTTRRGTYKCYGCRKPFTIKVGTVLESSHVPMHVWLQAICLLYLSKREISANQLAHALGISLRTACLIRRRLERASRNSSGYGDENAAGSPPAFIDVPRSATPFTAPAIHGRTFPSVPAVTVRCLTALPRRLDPRRRLSNQPGWLKPRPGRDPS